MIIDLTTERTNGTPISMVYNCCNMDLMAQVPDKFFDLAIVDPEYGIGVTDNKSGMGRRKGDAKATYKIGDWDKKPPPKEYFKELFRVSENQIIWGGNYFIEHLRSSKCFIVWDKKFSNDVSFASCEIAWASFDSTAKLFTCHPVCSDRIHVTQKPVSLYSFCLSNYAQPGNRILDTHLGSQSSRIAAYKLGFDFWGCELDEQYFKEGCERFDKAIAEPLFDSVPRVSQTNFFDALDGV